MIGQQIDLVAGDFNGTAWRCSNRDNISTIDEPLPTTPSPTPLLGPGSIPHNRADVCGFLKPPDSDRYWKVRMHGAFSIPSKTLGLRPTDQSCRHETWLHLDFVDWRNSQSHHEEPDRRILPKERPAPHQATGEARLGFVLCPCFICVCVEHSLCATPLTNASSLVPFTTGETAFGQQ